MQDPLAVPRPVLPGDHIRIVSPGLPIISHVPERGRRGEKALRDLGFEVSYGKHALAISADGLTAGTAEERAEDLMAAFADPEVDAILISDSGHGGRELPALLDSKVIASNPKAFIGFCDTVFINQFMASEAGLSSYYGCSIMFHLGDAGGPFPEVGQYLLGALDSSQPLVCQPVGLRARPHSSWLLPHIEQTPKQRDTVGGWDWIRPGSARGPLYGGEIAQVPEVAEQFGISFDSAIMFWDISEERTDPIDRLFGELCEKVDLSGIAGMIIGANAMLPPPQWAAELRRLVDKFCPGKTFPILANADLSHMTPSWTVPYGEEVILGPEGITFPRNSQSLAS